MTVVVTRRSLDIVLRAVIAAYMVAVAAMPFAHHDIVCHIKSSTHCSTCHVGTSGDQSNVRPLLARVSLADAGQLHHQQPAHAGDWALSPSAGRAPPVVPVATL